MLVSVIVPVYNVEKYLRECLDSILAQTYKNIEVIMVDDGSKDQSGLICDEYAKKYDNFKVVHKENAGLGMARNTGMEHMSGDVVTFLDSDDYIDENLIARLCEAMVHNQVDMCKSGFKRVDDEHNMFDMIQYEDAVYPGEGARTQMLPRMLGSRPDKKDSIEMAVCGAMYNCKIIKSHNLQFPSERQLISEDLVFNIEYMQYANGACILSDVGYSYRYNISSLTKSYRPDRFEANCHFYREIKKRLLELDYDNMAILRLQRLFFVYLMMALSQENKTTSGHTKKQCLHRIKEICSDQLTQEIIGGYPVSKLGTKQKIFVYLVKHRMAKLLYLYFKR